MPPGARRPQEATTRNGDGCNGEDQGGGAEGQGPPAGVSNGRAADHEQYSRSPKNPALQLLQKSSKSASAGS